MTGTTGLTRPALDKITRITPNTGGQDDGICIRDGKRRTPITVAPGLLSLELTVA
jgi:hypothetical protein